MKVAIKKIGVCISMWKNNRVKGWAWQPASLLLVFFLSGCALQSSLVDLELEIEEEAEKTQQIREELNLLRAEVEKQAKEARAEKPQQVSNQKGIVELVGELDRLKQQMRRLEGRIEEEGRKASEAMLAVDNQSHEFDMLSEKVASIEKRITAEKSAGEPVAATAALSPTEAYTLAYNDYLRGNYDLAIMGFQNYLKEYPNAAFVPQALYWTGQSYYNKAAYTDAVSYFEQIEARFPQHNTAPNAMLKMGYSLIELSKVDLAKAMLQKVIDRFPESNEARLAKDKLMSIH